MKIAIVGDVFITKPQNVSIDKSVIDLFNGCQYRVVNLEGPINGGEEIVPPKKSGSSLKQPTSIIGFLKSLNVDAVTLSNNHIMDYGEQGYLHTIKYLKDIATIGAGKWQDAYRMHVIEAENQSIGILNYCEMQFGMLYDDWTQNNNTIGCAWINYHKVEDIIRESRAKVDYLICICHAGVEEINIPLPEWRDKYRSLIDCGCDAIICHHPHIVQGIEIYNGKPIHYSLGNFCFRKDIPSQDKEWNTGAVAVLNIDENKIFLETYGVELAQDRLIIIDEKSWNLKMKGLNEMLEEATYKKAIKKKCTQLLKERYWGLFAIGGLFNPKKLTVKLFGRVLLGYYNNVHLLNNMQCESHRWCISRALQEEINKESNNKKEK